MENAALVTVYNARTYPESMHATTERTAATQWRKSAGLTRRRRRQRTAARSALLSALKQQGREREREESAVMGCTRQCFSAVSSSGIRMHTRCPDWRERSLLSVSLFFFRAPFFCRLVTSSFSRPTRCPLCTTGANVLFFFSPLSHVFLLPVRIPLLG